MDGGSPPLSMKISVLFNPFLNVNNSFNKLCQNYQDYLKTLLNTILNIKVIFFAILKG